MPAGKGTYGSKKGRPPKKGGKAPSKGLAALAKKAPKVAAAIMKNKRKVRSNGTSSGDNYHHTKNPAKPDSPYEPYKLSHPHQGTDKLARMKKRTNTMSTKRKS